MTEPPALDLRSDTVTRPSPEMREAIAQAEVGDDVLDGDPTTRRLEERVAAILGHERALFFPTGTQANQVAIALHARPGEEIIVDGGAHILHLEEGGAAALWGVSLRTVDAPDGVLNPYLVEPLIRDPSFGPRTAALSVENTHNAAGGKITPIDETAKLRALAESRDLTMHIDGARLWNAAAALGVAVRQIAEYGHTVMVSFHKGLGCPAGACLAGPAAWLERGVGLRRRLGGGMRQSGILAAACVYALDHHLPRLADDHRRAERLASHLDAANGFTTVAPETNIVMLDVHEERAEEAARRLRDAGLLVSVFGRHRLRAVVHLDLTDADVDRAAEIIRQTLR